MEKSKLKWIVGGALFISVLLSGTTFSFADNNGGPTEIIVLNPKKTIGNRQKAPSMQQVSCTYYDGNLYFEFAFPEGQCQLLLSDLVTGETVAAGFDSSASEPVYVGYHSTASITVTTANGNTYSGTW